MNCYRPTLEFSSITRRQVDVLTMANLVVMTGNVIANMLVICVLIKIFSSKPTWSCFV